MFCSNWIWEANCEETKRGFGWGGGHGHKQREEEGGVRCQRGERVSRTISGGAKAKAVKVMKVGRWVTNKMSEV